MRIAYCTPGVGPSGGARVIFEHCKHLHKIGHDVTIINPSGNSPAMWEWYGDLGDVPVVRNVASGDKFDVVVATGMQTVSWSLRVSGAKRVYFVQMMEHLFFRKGTPGYHEARRSYDLAKKTGFQVITIAKWLQESLEEFGLESDIIPNGVSEEFKPSQQKQNYILIEGDGRNPAKDTDGIAWAVAEVLQQKYEVGIYGYAAYEHERAGQADEFFVRPTQQQMNALYSGALFLLKTSRYEGRSCAPVEAMACGTPTVRGIISGDDDLTHENNSLRVGYGYEDVLEQAERMFTDTKLRGKLTRACRRYARKNLRWPKITKQLDELLGR